VHDTATIDWSVQDAHAIFEGNTKLRKLTNTVTDSAAIVSFAAQSDRLVERKAEQMQRRVVKSIQRFLRGAVANIGMTSKRGEKQRGKHFVDNKVHVSG
jgi:hypothetical protein